MLKTLLAGAALLLLPVAANANSHMEKKDPAASAAAPGALPKCSAKVQDSCDQSMTTEKNAIDHYPAETRDAGNFKTGKGGMAMAKTTSRKRTAKNVMPMAETTPADAPMAADPAK